MDGLVSDPIATYSIRTAEFEDLDTLIGLARLYHEEAHGEFAFVPDYVREQFRARCIDTVDGIALVLWRDDEPAGFLAAVVSMLFGAPVKIAVELAWYVKPDARGRGALLLDEYETWARERGCVKAALGMNELPDPKRSEALAAIYRRRGYRAYERGFIKDVAA